MQIFILTCLLLAVSVLLMSVGVIMGRKPIAGSCGGMSALGIKDSCDICGGDANRCENAEGKSSVVREAAEALFHDAGSKPRG